MIARRIAIFAALLVALVPSSAPAQPKTATLTHVVKKGDTLQLLAAEYYGDRQHAVFIMVENGIDHPRPLKPGQRLRIPIGREVTANVGDTLAGLAATYLGDARRAPFLAEMNSLPANASIAAGQEIQIPFHVTHKAAATESLASIAAAYFGSPKHANLLKQYNFLSTSTLAAGDTIVVPIYHVRVREARRPPPDPESRARRKLREAMQAQAQEALPGARAAWQAGNYAAVKQTLIKLDIDYLDTAIAVDVAVLLGSAYVAFGDNDSALALFRQALDRAPDFELSAYDRSPKICAVWKQAGGTIDQTK